MNAPGGGSDWILRLMTNRLGRPRIPTELLALIRRMAPDNPVWGEERIAGELLVKLGIRVSPRTVRKYMPKRPAGQLRNDQRRSTFLKNHFSLIVVEFTIGIGSRPRGDATNSPAAAGISQ
ncbi:MAG: helix-turn-helix domain-containing protein [Burkholderiales bacterium]